MRIPYPRVAGGSHTDADVVVLGAGAAGLYAALTAARAGGRVTLVSATPLAETASYWAQGGLAAALAEDDSPEKHRADTEVAGRGLVRTAAAELLCRDAPSRVRDLEGFGVHFDADRFGRLVLALEGGHSVRRVVHAGGSATGRRVVRELSAAVVTEPAIDVREGRRAAGLWTPDGVCAGVLLDDGTGLAARAVIVATGGAAALWSRTTNPPGSLGTGLLIAYDAGAALADLELMQFHPTAVIGVPGREGFLITEAVRGEGAVLLDAAGERFVDELAPRDEVSRAIHTRIKETGAQSVSLDMRTIDPTLFPNVVAALRDSGLDPTRELVPVAPAAHYMMGGIVTDLGGRSTVPGLYAVGEAACTGLHGANRLASNSLSECFVFGARSALRALDEPASVPTGEPPQRPIERRAPPRETRDRLWEHAGIERDRAGLAQLLDEDYPLAVLIARCALMREETRGAHVRTDFPETNPDLDRMHVVVSRDAEPRFERWD
jgi:L-aspartate oxidase